MGLIHLLGRISTQIFHQSLSSATCYNHMGGGVHPINHFMAVICIVELEDVTVVATGVIKNDCNFPAFDRVVHTYRLQRNIYIPSIATVSNSFNFKTEANYK